MQISRQYATLKSIIWLLVCFIAIKTLLIFSYIRSVFSAPMKQMTSAKIHTEQANTPTHSSPQWKEFAFSHFSLN